MHKTFFLSSLLVLSLTTASWADDVTPPPESSESPAMPTEERVQRRETALSQEQKRMLKQKRATERENEAEETSNPLMRKASFHYRPFQQQFQLAPSNLKAEISFAEFSPFIPDYCHWLVNIGPTRHTLEMEDGTQWEINPADSYLLSYWEKSDPLMVTANNNWFSSGDFYITNKNKGAQVRADLVVSPIAFGSYSHWIIGIDHYSGHVYLENGTTWCVNSADWFAFRDWAVNDHVIMGYNDSWFTPYDRILINFNMDSFVRAKQY